MSGKPKPVSRRVMPSGYSDNVGEGQVVRFGRYPGGTPFLHLVKAEYDRRRDERLKTEQS